MSVTERIRDTVVLGAVVALMIALELLDGAISMIDGRYQEVDHDA